MARMRPRPSLAATLSYGLRLQALPVLHNAGGIRQHSFEPYAPFRRWHPVVTLQGLRIHGTLAPVVARTSSKERLTLPWPKANCPLPETKLLAA